MNIFLLLFLLVVSVIMMTYGLTHLNHNEKYDKSNVLPKSDNTSKQQQEPAQQEQPDPTNPYDQNAIKIVTSEGHRVGYVPKYQTQYVHDFASLPCRCYCYIGSNDGFYFTDCYITRNDK